MRAAEAPPTTGSLPVSPGAPQLSSSLENAIRREDSALRTTMKSGNLRRGTSFDKKGSKGGKARRRGEQRRTRQQGGSSRHEVQQLVANRRRRRRTRSHMLMAFTNGLDTLDTLEWPELEEGEGEGEGQEAALGSEGSGGSEEGEGEPPADEPPAEDDPDEPPPPHQPDDDVFELEDDVGTPPPPLLRRFSAEQEPEAEDDDDDDRPCAPPGGDPTFWLDAAQHPAELAADATALDLHAQDLRSVPALPARVTALRLSNNRLAALPPSVRALQRLRVLHAQNNQLRQLPDGEYWAELEELNLYNNALTALPACLARMEALTTLNLEFNNLSELPAEIGALQQLVSLNVSCNLLTSLPAEVADLPRLAVLEAAGNPLQEPPLHTVAMGAPHVRRYFAGVRSFESRPVRMGKIVVIGHPHAGKMSLLRRLVGKAAAGGEDAAGDGVCIEYWNPTETLDVSVWAFSGAAASAGTEHEHEHAHWLAAAPMLFSAEALYLLAWDARRGSTDDFDECVQFWVDAIQTRVPGAVIQLVATHADELPPGELEARADALLQRLRQHDFWRRDSLRRRFEQLAGRRHAFFAPEFRRQLHDTTLLLERRPRLREAVVAVSSLTGQGVDALRAAVVELLGDPELFPLVGAVVPEPWLRVRDVVRAQRESTGPVREWDLFVSDCTQVDVPADMVKDAVDFLGSVGELLFSDGSVVFLDANWPLALVRRMYGGALRESISRWRADVGQHMATDRAEELLGELENKAVLSTELLGQLWPDVQLNPRVFAAVWRVLETCGVVLPLTRPAGGGADSPRAAANAAAGRGFLVPGLLTRPAQPPRLAHAPGKLRVGRRWRFHRFAPPGLFARLIARTLQYGRDAVCRRDVAVIRCAGATAVHLQLSRVATAGSTTVHDLDVSAVGRAGDGAARLWDVLDRFVRHAEQLVDSFPGVLVDRSALCPLCWEAGATTAFPLAKVMQAHAAGDDSLLCKEVHDVPYAMLAPGVDSFSSAYAAVYAVAVVDPASGALLNYGSACCVDADRGLLLTCAHVVRAPGEGQQLLRGRVVVAAFVSEQEAPQWRFAAEIAAEPNAASVSSGGELFDAAVLRVTHQLAAPHVLAPVVPRTLPLAQLPLGDSALLHVRETITLLGYPLGGGICETSGPVRQFCNGLINVEAYQDAGSSGGPALNARGEVVGLVSKGTSNVALLVPEGEMRPLLRSLGV